MVKSGERVWTLGETAFPGAVHSDDHMNVRTLDIPPGDYSASTLALTMQQVLNYGAFETRHPDVLSATHYIVTASGNNFSIDFLNGGDEHVHEFTVKPIKKTTHRIRAAKMTFIDGEEGENTIMHYSNVLPDLRIAAESHQLEATLLKIGKLATLNIVQTKQGWMVAGGVLGALAAFQVYAIFSTVIKRRRHLRALEDVKRM